MDYDSEELYNLQQAYNRGEFEEKQRHRGSWMITFFVGWCVGFVTAALFIWMSQH